MAGVGSSFIAIVREGLLSGLPKQHHSLSNESILLRRSASRVKKLPHHEVFQSRIVFQACGQGDYAVQAARFPGEVAVVAGADDAYHFADDGVLYVRVGIGFDGDGFL